MLKFLINFLNTPVFLLTATLTTFFIKGYLCSYMLFFKQRNQTTNLSMLFLLTGILVGSMLGDFSWIAKLARALFFPTISYAPITFIARIAWAFLVMQYQCLAFFTIGLFKRKFYISRADYISIGASTCCALYHLYAAFFSNDLLSEAQRSMGAFTHMPFTQLPLEIIMKHITVIYLIPLLMLSSLIYSFYLFHTTRLPKILRQQIGIIFRFFIPAYLLLETFIATHCFFSPFDRYRYAVVALSALFITLLSYYAIWRVLSMRFLNMSERITAKNRAEFVTEFKLILRQLSTAQSLAELTHITQTFFYQACAIPLLKTTVMSIRPPLFNIAHSNTVNSKQSAVTHPATEEFIRQLNQDEHQWLKSQRLIAYDDLEFTNFYHHNLFHEKILSFMEHKQMELFVPIYHGTSMIAFIAIERGAHGGKLYTRAEHDEIMIFASYLANLIPTLLNQELEPLMYKEKQLQEELLIRHKEMMQYQEALQSFFRESRCCDIGIIFYRNRRFILANQAAHDLIAINPNTHEGHPITKKLRELVHNVNAYKCQQKALIRGISGKQLSITAMPNTDPDIILTVSYPHAAELINSQLTLLKDPIEWENLLHLETTTLGTKINNFIPSTDEYFINLKTKYVAAAITTSPLLLDVSAEDTADLIHLIHACSNLRTLYMLTPTMFTRPEELRTKLFGEPSTLNASLSGGIMQELSPNGTLFIEHIDQVDPTIQLQLFDVIIHGHYTVAHTEYWINNTIRLLATTTKRWPEMQSNQTPLLSLLQRQRLTLPNPQDMPEEKFIALAQGYIEQLYQENNKPVRLISRKELSRLISRRPHSWSELKRRIKGITAHRLQQEKGNRSRLEDLGDIDAVLTKTAHLGKQALKNQDLMRSLWDTFKNQSKIAAYLGVNRSSVNRRCRVYGLK